MPPTVIGKPSDGTRSKKAYAATYRAANSMSPRSLHHRTTLSVSPNPMKNFPRLVKFPLFATALFALLIAG